MSPKAPKIIEMKTGGKERNKTQKRDTRVNKKEKYQESQREKS